MYFKDYIKKSVCGVVYVLFCGISFGLFANSVAIKLCAGSTTSIPISSPNSPFTSFNIHTPHPSSPLQYVSTVSITFVVEKAWILCPYRNEFNSKQKHFAMENRMFKHAVQSLVSLLLTCSCQHLLEEQQICQNSTVKSLNKGFPLNQTKQY